MKIKKYRNDNFITIRLSQVELIRLSRIIDEGLFVLNCQGKDLPIDFDLKLVTDCYIETLTY